MRKFLTNCALSMGIATLLLAPALVQADEPEVAVCNHSTGKTDDTFFGGARFILSPIFVSEDSAISILAETGSNNYRANGTWGFISCNSRFKIGAEYLTQHIKYNFPDEGHRVWRQQFAIGGNYQYLLDCPEWFVEGIQITGYYSRAQNHSLHDFTCQGTGRTTGTIERGVAGARAWGADFGVITRPWCCSDLIVSVGYDNFNYGRHLQSNSRVSGVGVTLDFTQRLMWNLTANVTSQFKRAYNALEAKLSWTTCFDCGELEIGVYGGHVWGKNRLPSTSNAGLELGFAFGIDNCCQFTGIDCCGDCCHQGNNLAEWVRDPAVYMPQVFAISEYRNVLPQ